MNAQIKWVGWLLLAVLPWTASADLAENTVVIDGVPHTLTDVTEPRVKARIQEAMRWFAARTGLNANIPLPEIKSASRAYMRRIYQQLRQGDPGQAIGALYYFTRDAVTKKPKRMVLLLEKDVFDAQNPKQFSKAAHEAFHHVQFMNGLLDRLSCAGKLEAQAYRAQADWLIEHHYWDSFFIRHLYSIARRYDICRDK
ncbi:MAG: hypothetical protein ETSY1_03345 [Candidatus Entotheonella factor]|uniref:Uncharacterized protein n=1 Tax=Entotheonella factor TaxID=1429438 RepID=W4LWK4_ENTF1|nr:hypothetical protein [Candidatus Entotheonella palauensis]ETX02494.1 MAG: hypothetical protein ETSY1_03345 [Candidatus Entotheonella factor]